ncbi:MAG: hypothetical protein WB565_14665 [Acidimicrobiales bacterium]
MDALGPSPPGAVGPGGLGIPHPPHDATRTTPLQAALARVDGAELTGALAESAPQPQAAVAVRNAFNALRRHRDPASVLDRPQYRPALPLVAAAVSEKCLAACVDRLGDHSDDPTKEQLLEALDAIGADFPPPTVAVMLASVADSHMPASDLCLEILTTDDRFGLTGETDGSSDEVIAGVTDEARDGGDSALAVDGRTASAARPVEGVDDVGADGSQRREERRLRRRRDAEARRKRSDAARRSAEQVRRARRRRPEAPSHEARANPVVGAPTSNAPRLRRRAVLTPAQERDFDRDDPWSGAVLFAWIPFDRAEEGVELEGKSRRCVVVAGSADHLLVRPGYSEGGSKSRDWKAVELRGWRRAGFDQPTWIDFEAVPVERDPEVTPVGWLSAEDWNALW